jgi:hypothetical protein
MKTAGGVNNEDAAANITRRVEGLGDWRGAGPKPQASSGQSAGQRRSMSITSAACPG